MGLTAINANQVTVGTTSLAAEPNPTTPTEVLNTKQLGLGIAPGYDVTIGHYFCRDRNNNDHFIEFTFWGLNSWSFSKYLNGYFVPIYDTGIAYSPESPADHVCWSGRPRFNPGNFKAA